jgi:hypothetical protein
MFVIHVQWVGQNGGSREGRGIEGFRHPCSMGQSGGSQTKQLGKGTHNINRAILRDIEGFGHPRSMRRGVKVSREACGN